LESKKLAAVLTVPRYPMRQKPKSVKLAP